MRRLTSVLVTTAFTAATLTACSSELCPEEEARPVTVLIVGDHANGSMPRFSGTKIEETVDSTLSACGTVSVVNVDGDPAAQGLAHTPIEANHPERLKKAVAAAKTQVQNALKYPWAAQPETDPLAALTEAHKEIAGAKGPRTILMVDSGLQTTGAISFVPEGALGMEPEDVAAHLHANGRNLPDLTGIDVVWVGLGNTSEPQEDLTTGMISNLEAIWKAVIEDASGTVTFAPEPAAPPAPDATPRADLPPVTVVDVADAAALAGNSTDFSGPVCVQLDEGVVNFKQHKAIFVDRPGAEELLAESSTTITEQHLLVTLVGTTATGRHDEVEAARTLARERVAAVRDILVGQGVEPDSIKSQAYPWTEDPHHVTDVVDGVLIPLKAAKNRRVTMVLTPPNEPASSATISACRA
jgi:hypothetical protein